MPPLTVRSGSRLRLDDKQRVLVRIPQPEHRRHRAAHARDLVVDVPSREDALAWAAKNAGACRCAQEVREFMPDPAVGN